MSSINVIDGGGVTSARDFVAGATYVGIKTYGSEPRLDLGLLASLRPSAVAGIFTRNAVQGAPVLLSRPRADRGSGRAVVVNSGCSNVATGEGGLGDAQRMTALAADKLGIPESEALVASTGVIGRRLDMQRIERGLTELSLDREGGTRFARAMMTTDTVEKACAVRLEHAGRIYVVGGAAKGAGMVHPDMATLLCFLTTDAPIDAPVLRDALKRAADNTLNMLDVDMDTSTSDSALLFANGAAGGAPFERGSSAEAVFDQALETVLVSLTKQLARDAEGARTLIEVEVHGAASVQDARLAARTVVSSPLVKTMVTGRDPNVGRVLMALGRSGCRIELSRTRVYVGAQCAFEGGEPSDVDYSLLSRAMDAPEVQIRVDLGIGEQRATAWGCDLTEDYIRINADYTT